MFHARAVFADADLGEIHIQPQPQVAGQAVEVGSQTATIEAFPAATQTVVFAHAEAQTSTGAEAAAAAERAANAEGGGRAGAAAAAAAAAVVKSGAARLMERELARADASRAFDGYEAGGADADAAAESGATYKYSIYWEAAPPEEKLQACGVSWSATGSTLCVAYGRKDAAGWCDGVGALCAWNLFAPTFDRKKPTHCLEHASPLQCVACHPLRPSVVAAGSFGGEIVVWDLSEDEPLLAATRADDYFHREPITAVRWAYESLDAAEPQLVSVSGDGKVLWWSLAAIDKETQTLPNPARGMRLQARQEKHARF